MKRILFIALALFCTMSSRAQEDNSDNFDEIINEFNQEFEEFRKQAIEEYDKYEATMIAEYNRYRKSIGAVWGNDNTAEDTRTEWVEYSDDFKSRSVVDFDEGKIEVEVVLDDVNETDSVEIQKKLTDAIEKMLTSQGSTCPYKSQVDERKPLSNRPILEGLVDLSQYEIEKLNAKKLDSLHREEEKRRLEELRKKDEEAAQKILEAVKKKRAEREEQKAKELAEKNEKEKKAHEQAEKQNAKSAKEQEEEDMKRILMAIKKQRQQKETETGRNKERSGKERYIAKNIAKQSKKTTTTIKGNDNKVRKVVKVEMALVSDNLSKSAALYKDYVKEYSQKFQIEEPLIYAVMEQESRFNPKAKSHIPAYGLMQLVPRSGGLDAYRYVYKRDQVPTSSYLYVPHQNIELGTAYLRVLMNQFKNVTDPNCRRLCVIASYNTGAGNVSRAFTGNTNIKKAIPLINNYSYDELYRHLSTRLSTSEARNYVTGVSKRREKYLK